MGSCARHWTYIVPAQLLLSSNPPTRLTTAVDGLFRATNLQQLRKYLTRLVLLDDIGIGLLTTAVWRRGFFLSLIRNPILSLLRVFVGFSFHTTRPFKWALQQCQGEFFPVLRRGLASAV